MKVKSTFQTTKAWISLVVALLWYYLSCQGFEPHYPHWHPKKKKNFQTSGPLENCPAVSFRAPQIIELRINWSEYPLLEKINDEKWNNICLIFLTPQIHLNFISFYSLSCFCFYIYSCNLSNINFFPLLFKQIWRIGSLLLPLTINHDLYLTNPILRLIYLRSRSAGTSDSSTMGISSQKLKSSWDSVRVRRGRPKRGGEGDHSINNSSSSVWFGVLFVISMRNWLIPLCTRVIFFFGSNGNTFCMDNRKWCEIVIYFVDFFL